MNIGQVKKIMGNNFIGPSELKKISSKLNIADPTKMKDLIPEIPLTLSYLKKISKDYILILGIPKDKYGEKFHVSINDLVGRIFNECFLFFRKI